MNVRNKVTLIGNLGSEPEIKTFEGNKKMARVSIATNETYKNKDGERMTETTWHTLVAWGSLVTILEKLTHKGSKVAIEGKLVNNSYFDKEGIKRYSSEVQLNNLVLLANS